jgi:tetratricopeptide (TPR) repeat protein
MKHNHLVRRGATAGLLAVTALAIGLAAFLAHTVFDMDWNFVATCGPLLLVAGALAGRASPDAEPIRVRRPLLAVGAVLFALAAFYSLAAPWLAKRQLATAVSASAAKKAHGFDPLSTSALIDWAAFEDAGGNVLKANDLYEQAVSLESQSSETWYALGLFYWEHQAWKPAYGAFSKAWTYDRFGPAGIPCGSLDQARHKALGTWPPSCPRGRPRAATP